MNIVEMIRNQISGSAISQLGQLIGKSESTTRSAVSATIPSLLASFSKMASTESGMQVLQGTLEKFDPKLLDERPDAVAVKGSGMAESLLGSAGTSSLANSLTRSFGIGSFGADRLLGFLTPAVLGGIARQFAGKTLSPASLTSFFSDQKRAISQAVPSGFAGAESALHAGVDKVKDTARAFAGSDRPRARWILPAVLGLAVVAVALFVSRPRPSGPGRPERADEDVAARLGSELDTAVGSLTGTLSGITDEASADAALPKIAEARGKLDDIRATAARLPEEGKAKVDQRIRTQIGALQEQSDRVASIPGAGEKIKPVLDDLMTRLSTPVGGAPADGAQEVK